MVKKRTHSKKHISHNSTHILLKKSLFVYALLVFTLFVLIVLSAFTVVELKKAYHAHEYRQEVAEIYQNIKLDDSYRIASSDILANVTATEADDTDEQMSIVSYGRNADRLATFKDLKTRIEAAGFSQTESFEKANIAREDHYKNSEGERVSVSVDTVAWHNATLYGTDLPSPESDASTKTGPVYVTIQVSLDDE